MEPFGYEELSYDERLALGAMTQHPGFSAFKKLVDCAFRAMMVRIIELKRDEPDYIHKLEAAQMEAHLTKEICSTLIKSIAMHTEAGEIEAQVRKAQEQAENANVEIKNPAIVGQFGSVTHKPRKGEKSNT